MRKATRQPEQRFTRPTTVFLRAIPFVIALLVVLTGGARGEDRRTQADRAVVDRVVAVVNDDVVLNSELMMRVAPMAAELENVTDRKERERRQAKLRSAALDDMINEELIQQAAIESKLEVSAKEVQNALDEIKRQNNLDDNQLAEALSLQGYTPASYRQDVRKQILRMRAINMLVRPRVTVTDDDIKARYDEQSRRSATISKVRLSHALVALPEKPTEKELTAAKERAAQIVQRSRAGEEFAKLVEELSDDERTKPIGGDLGWIERGSIDTEWEVIVFSMSKGETRGPINGPAGLHVFHVVDVETTEQKPFEEMKETIRNELYRREMDRQTKLWLEELRKKAHIEKKI
jgi:parvulin-like peptidyl-prolyl isomerase